MTGSAADRAAATACLCDSQGPEPDCPNHGREDWYRSPRIRGILAALPVDRPGPDPDGGIDLTDDEYAAYMAAARPPDWADDDRERVAYAVQSVTLGTPEGCDCDLPPSRLDDDAAFAVADAVLAVLASSPVGLATLDDEARAKEDARLDAESEAKCQGKEPGHEHCPDCGDNPEDHQYHADGCRRIGTTTELQCGPPWNPWPSDAADQGEDRA